MKPTTPVITLTVIRICELLKRRDCEVEYKEKPKYCYLYKV